MKAEDGHPERETVKGSALSMKKKTVNDECQALSVKYKVCYNSTYDVNDRVSKKT